MKILFPELRYIVAGWITFFVNRPFNVTCIVNGVKSRLSVTSVMINNSGAEMFSTIKKYRLKVSVFLKMDTAFSQERGFFDGNLSISGTITGFKKGAGIYIALYDSQQNFKNKKFTNALRIPADSVRSDSITYKLFYTPLKAMQRPMFSNCKFDLRNDLTDVNLTFINMRR